MYDPGWILESVKLFEEVPDAGGDCRQFLRSRLRCPIQCTSPAARTINRKLEGAWLDHCNEQYVVDLEMSFTLGSHMSIDEKVDWDWAVDDPTPEELRIDAINVGRWYWPARNAFLSRTKIIYAPVADDADYPKHFSAKGIPAKTLAKRTKGKNMASILDPGLSIDWFASATLGAGAIFMDELVDADQFRCAVPLPIDVGFAQGRATNWLAIEWGQRLCHFYPVSESEAGAIGRPADASALADIVTIEPSSSGQS